MHLTYDDYLDAGEEAPEPCDLVIPAYRRAAPRVPALARCLDCDTIATSKTIYVGTKAWDSCPHCGSTDLDVPF